MILEAFSICHDLSGFFISHLHPMLTILKPPKNLKGVDYENNIYVSGVFIEQF